MVPSGTKVVSVNALNRPLLRCEADEVLAQGLKIVLRTLCP